MNLIKLRVLIIVVTFALIGTSGCYWDNDEPITSPHATVLVNLSKEGGPTYLFASNRFLDTVYRINLDNMKIDEVQVGTKPRNIAARPDGTKVAVANESSRNITLIDTKTLGTCTVQTGFFPKDIKFSPDGKWLAVANYESDSVSLINSKNFDLWDIWIGGGPVSVDFDDQSMFVAVAAYNEDSIKIISVSEKEVVQTWSHGQNDFYFDRPQVVLFGKSETNSENTIIVGSRLSPDENWDYHADYDDSIAVLYLTPNWRDLIASFVPNSDVIRAAPNPRGLFWNHNSDRVLAINHYFFNDTPWDKVSVLDVSEGRNVEETRRYTVDKDPVAAALSPDKDLFAVACKKGGAVNLIDIEKQTIRYVKTLALPYALAFNNKGTKVIVVHESALMPVSVVDVVTGKSEVVYESIAMDEWID